MMMKYIFIGIVALWLLGCSYVMLTYNAGTRFIFIALLTVFGLSFLTMKVKRGQSFWQVYGIVLITLQWIINIVGCLGFIVYGIIKCCHDQWITGLAFIFLGPILILWVIKNVFALFMIPALAAISASENSSSDQGKTGQ